MSRNIISNQIFSFTKANPKKKAISTVNGLCADYSDIASIYADFSAFASSSEIDLNHRIALISRDPLAYCLLSLPILEKAVYVSLEPDLTPEKYEADFDLLKIDYVLTDLEEISELCKTSSRNPGVILFEMMGVPSRLKASFHLISRPLYAPYLSSTAICHLDTTSGTTSTPKVVPTTYAGFVATSKSNARFYHFDKNDVTLITTKASRCQTTNALIRSLFTGSACVLLNEMNHNNFIQVLNQEKITWFTSSPAVLTSLANYIEKSAISLDYSCLRFIRSSGAPLTHKLKLSLENFFHVPVIQTYGMTETKMISSAYQAPKGYKEGSVGVSSCLDIKVLDGEIVVRGDTVFEGYEGNDELNKNSFIDGWFRTGDMGFIDEDGYIFITGRIKEMINRGGEKISPYEVEEALLKIAPIKTAYVFPYPNDFGSEDVGAVVVLKEGAILSLLELRRALRGSVPSFKMPTLLYVIDEIPIGSNGKVQRRLLYDYLKTNYPNGADDGNAESLDSRATSPDNLNPTQKILVELWSELLKKKQIQLQDHFFESGGDSLSAAAMFSYVEETFRLQVPMNIFFKNPTLEALADYIDHAENRTNKFKFLVPLKDTGHEAPLFCVHTGDGEAVTYHHLSRSMPESRPVYALRFDIQNPDWQHPLTFEQLAQAYANEITQLHPSGPYHLCGTCFGGVLAFEIAQTLKNQGYQVETLAMFDSVYNSGKRRRYSRLLRNSLDELREAGFSSFWPLIRKKFDTMLLLLNRSRRKERYLNQLNTSDTLDISEVSAILSSAHSLYHAKPYDGRLSYFLTTKDKVKESDAVSYWQRMVTEFDVIPMYCRHTEINDAANAMFLAEKLSEIMEDAHA